MYLERFHHGRIFIRLLFCPVTTADFFKWPEILVVYSSLKTRFGFREDDTTDTRGRLLKLKFSLENKFI